MGRRSYDLTDRSNALRQNIFDREIWQNYDKETVQGKAVRWNGDFVEEEKRRKSFLWNDLHQERKTRDTLGRGTGQRMETGSRRDAETRREGGSSGRHARWHGEE